MLSTFRSITLLMSFRKIGKQLEEAPQGGLEQSRAVLRIHDRKILLEREMNLEDSILGEKTWSRQNGVCPQMDPSTEIRKGDADRLAPVTI